jgi:hypothetical protein
MDDLLLKLNDFIDAWYLHIKLSFGWKNIFEICIIAAILIIFYQKFIKNTHSEKFVKGAVALVFLWIFGEVLTAIDLTILCFYSFGCNPCCVEFNRCIST